MARTSTSAASVTGRGVSSVTAATATRRAPRVPLAPLADGGERGDVREVVTAAHGGEVVAGRQQAAHGRPFGERQRRAHLEGEVAGGDGEAALPRRLDHAREDLVPRRRGVLRQPVVDGEHGPLVLDHDAERLAVEVAGRRLGDLVDDADVPLRLRLDGDGAVGGSSSPGRACRRRPRRRAGSCGGRPRATRPVTKATSPIRPDQRGEQLAERVGDVRVGGARGDRRDRPVDVAEERRRGRSPGGGAHERIQRLVPTDDRRPCFHGSPKSRSPTAYPLRSAAKLVAGSSPSSSPARCRYPRRER